MAGLAITGGIIALVQFGTFGPFLTGSVSAGGKNRQQIFDALTGGITPLTLTNPGANDWRTFIYPATGNPNIDSDTFKQCVLIHLPKGFTGPSDLVYKDPVTGDSYAAFSRVCVHLWCLWNYFPKDMRMECPCHGSQYVPGTGQYPAADPLHTIESDQSPGLAVAGPASLQTPPNNQLPMITLEVDSSGNFFATGIVGQIGCGQKC